MRSVFAIAMKQCGVIILTAVLCALCPSPAGAVPDAQPLDAKNLTRDLARVREEVSWAMTNVVLTSKGLNEAQNRLATEDGEYARLIAEKTGVNSNIVARKAELDLQLKNNEIWQKAEQKRRAAMEKLVSARDNEAERKAALSSASAEMTREAESAWIASTRDREDAQREMEAAEQELYRISHDLAYQPGPCQDAHREIKALEANLLRIRAALAVREKLNDAWRAADQARRQAYAQLKAAQQQEQVLRSEIARAENGAGQPPSVESGQP